MSWTFDKKIGNKSDSINHVSFSPDGSKIALAGGSGSWVYNRADGSQLAELASDTTYFSICSPDGNYIAINDFFNGVILFDSNYNEVGSVLKYDDYLFDSVWGPNSNYFYTLVSTNAIVKFDLSPSEQTRSSIGEYYGGVAVSPLNDYVAYMEGNDLEVEDTSLNAVATITGVGDNEPRAPRFGPNRNYLAVGQNTSGDVKVVDTSDSDPNNWSEISDSPLTGTSVDTHGVAFSPNGDYLMYGSEDSNVYVYNTSDWTQISDSPFTNSSDQMGGFTGGVDWNESVGQFAVPSYDGNVYLYNYPTDLGFTIDGTPVKEVTIDGTQVSGLTIDGTTVF